MIPVILESPYAGQVGRNKLYLQACIRDCLRRSESPYASHQMLTEALDDKLPNERKQGIDAARAFYAVCFKSAVYIDFGISGGMAIGIERMEALGKPVEHRRLGGVWAVWDRLMKGRP